MNDLQSLRPDSDDESTNTSDNPVFDSILQARLSRRQLLGGSMGTAALAMLGGVSPAFAAASAQRAGAPAAANCGRPSRPIRPTTSMAAGMR